MLSDFEMITHKFPARPDLHLYAIGDVHLSAREHMEKEWQEFCTNFLKDKYARLVILGDLLNNAVKSSVSNVYDEIYRPREAKKMMVEMLKPLRGRCLCITTGNHERRSSREVDDDIMYDIACKLDLEHLYRENMAVVRIQMGNQEGHGESNPTYCFVVVHGAGGGSLPGGVLNRNERFGYAVDGADMIIVGHSHRPMVSQPAKLKIDPHNGKVSVKPFKVITATSWLNYGGYAAQKMLLPTSHARQVITLCGKKKEIRVEM